MLVDTYPYVAYFYEGLLLAALELEQPVVLVGHGLAHRLVRIPEALGRDDHVEGNRKCGTLVDVVHPQLGARELPLHVTVTLKCTCAEKLSLFFLPVYFYIDPMYRRSNTSHLAWSTPHWKAIYYFLLISSLN